MKGYRFVDEDLKSEHGMVQWTIGEWKKLQVDEEHPLKLCEYGLHGCDEPIDSLNYVFGNRWFMCEAKGKILKDSDKFCAQKMRLTKEIPIVILRKFAIECVRHVLPIFEKQYPNDQRPREAIVAAEEYLKNPSSENLKILKEKEMAAGAAAGAAGAAMAAAGAAGAAAGAAGAAGAAAGAARAAGAAERQWQNRKLKQLIKEA